MKELLNKLQSNKFSTTPEKGMQHILEANHFFSQDQSLTIMIENN